MLGRVVDVDFPLLTLFSVTLEASGFVNVVESQPMFGFELYCLGRLSGWVIIFFIS